MTQKGKKQREAQELLQALVDCLERDVTAERELLRRFAEWEGEIECICGESIDGLSDREAEVLSNWLRGTLVTLVKEHAQSEGFCFQYQGASVLIYPDGTTRPYLGMDLNDSATCQLLQLVRVVGLNRVRQCDCGRRFVRAGKKQHCSTRCQKRVFMRTYIPREARKDKGAR